MEKSFTLINQSGEMFALKTTEKHLDEFFDELNLSGEIKFTDKIPVFVNPIDIEITDENDEFVIGVMTCENTEILED